MTAFLPLRVVPVASAGTKSPGFVTQSFVVRHRGRIHVVVMTKIALELVQDGPMHLAPAPLFYDSDQLDETGSATDASDARGSRLATDITFVGQAYAPGHRAVDRLLVRVAIVRPDSTGHIEGGQPLLDKSLLMVGQRFATSQNRNPTPTPFVRLPISNSFALGGPGDSHNPIGVGREPDASGVVRLPCILQPPGSPNRALPLSYGPVPARWPERNHPALSLRRDTIDELPDDFDFSLFQSAPVDQRTELLRGDEWIYLENLRPYLPRVVSRLPDVVSEARVEMGDGTQQRLPLRIDGVAIHGDEGHVFVTSTGTFSVESERAFATLSIKASATTHGREPAWPAPRLDSDSGRAPPQFKGTMILELPNRPTVPPMADPETSPLPDSEEAPSTQVFSSSFERSRTMFLSNDAPPSTHSPFRLGKPAQESEHAEPSPIPGAPWEDHLTDPITDPVLTDRSAEMFRTAVVAEDTVDDTSPTIAREQPAPVIEDLAPPKPPHRKAHGDVWAKADPAAAAPSPAPPPRPKPQVPEAKLKKDALYGRFRKS